MERIQQQIRHAGLCLTPLCQDDNELFIELFTNTDVMKHIAPVMTQFEADELFKKALRCDSSAYYWSVSSDNDSGMGITALISTADDRAEFGLMLLPEYCNKGYSVPVGAALINFGFSVWGLEGVDVKHRISNKAVPAFLTRLHIEYSNEQNGFGYWIMRRSRWQQYSAIYPYQI
ncbi:GNAT family N-acetyltransferase [Rheinheimera sp.]|uniref:GNAT family N-acetyltransferase n=1 Tax=Rheinheimera sp. TaxID=1869214 RepID=UPI00307F07CA